MILEKQENDIFVLMMTKGKNLIFLFASLFLILIGIQAYFMYKTYVVKEKEIYRTVLDKSSGFVDNIEERNQSKDDEVFKVIADYANKKINKKQFSDYFNSRSLENKKELTSYINSQFKKEGYDVAVELKYNTIITLPDSVKLIAEPIILYSTENKVKKFGLQTTGIWNTSSTSTKDGTKDSREYDHFKIFTETNYQILNIKTVVFRELALLILLCFFILGAVLWLFILTIKNLIKQQKQVEILHTVVDNISHEFRTPIATLKVASKSLKKEWNPENFPLIDRQISRLENLMQHLENPSDNEHSPIEKSDWLFFIQDLQFLYPKANFLLDNTVSNTLYFPKSEMETIVKNLCENSVKYGATKIEILIKNLDNHIVIQVSDNGEGIAKNYQKAIFEKFYRIQSNNIHNTKGLGLGLFLVKNLVEKHQGKILVESELNKGTTFKIELPYEN